MSLTFDASAWKFPAGSSFFFVSDPGFCSDKKGGISWGGGCGSICLFGFEMFKRLSKKERVKKVRISL